MLASDANTFPNPCWKEYLSSLLSPLGDSLLFHCECDFRFHPLEIPEFYREILLSWSEFKLDDRDSVNIGDLFTENNHLVSYEYLSTKGIDFSTYMTWRGIIRAIKSKYREPKHLANENFVEQTRCDDKSWKNVIVLSVVIRGFIKSSRKIRNETNYYKIKTWIQNKWQWNDKSIQTTF